MDYLKAFIIGGLFCAVGQILIDKTNITPARVLVVFVVTGCLLGGLGWYDKLAGFAGAGATVPLPGFGSLLAKGVKTEIDSKGIVGILTGGLKSAAAGVSAAVFFSFLSALVFNPKEK
ncbi:MAG: stage V sporulation protein AE [Clostridiales bacterium]|jgi:stage V sporulation protein AE|nr:stage V sporulation protein AE [Clostridiales bacterium]